MKLVVVVAITSIVGQLCASFLDTLMNGDSEVYKELKEINVKIGKLATKDELENLDDRLKSAAAQSALKDESLSLDIRKIDGRVIRLEERSRVVQ